VYIAPTSTTFIQQYYPQQSALDGQQRNFTAGFQYGGEAQSRPREPILPRPLSSVSLLQRMENGPNQRAVNSYVDVANYEQKTRLRQMVGIDVYT